MKTLLMLMLLGFGSVSFAVPSSSMDNVIESNDSKEGITYDEHNGSKCGDRVVGKDSDEKPNKQIATKTKAVKNT